MDNFSELMAHSGSKCSNDEWTEYCQMPQVRTNETPGEWKERIWTRLQYFRDYDLLPTGGGEKYLEARRLTQVPSGNLYAPTIGMAICFSCDQLVYIGEMTKNMGNNYNHIGMEKHWATHCTGNKYCGVSYEEYQKITQKPKSACKFDDSYALRRYELWMINAIRRVGRARCIGKKIKACIKIQRKVVEWIYRPDGLTATELALHYARLQNIRAEMRQLSNL
ncbi:10293_t:CDS:1 [Entrophospora sp. SA101]|nr:10293_t:CDS:1 [Entrophospora sp. SA101]